MASSRKSADSAATIVAFSASASSGKAVSTSTSVIRTSLSAREILGFVPSKPTHTNIVVTKDPPANPEPPKLSELPASEVAAREAAARQRNRGLMSRVRAFGANLDSALSQELDPELLKHA